MTFDDDVPGTECTEYLRGGVKFQGCVSGSLLPMGVLFTAEKECWYYYEPHCEGWTGTTGRVRDLDAAPGYHVMQRRRRTGAA
ncbi:hypothetical protein CPLU01_07900 [Colletotrichum plurivorum]|uniref:Uncharacterized protein n=1 Tax=Colletotrichum plurivorum TaxID=2175906 RepID=A0A8H6KDB3_9PEZI|nr:hypothetical protein CPLU01_07900 [Colletotrichum plurivorum]